MGHVLQQFQLHEIRFWSAEGTRAEAGTSEDLGDIGRPTEGGSGGFIRKQNSGDVG